MGCLVIGNLGLGGEVGGLGVECCAEIEDMQLV
jgi:hypothetical protein